MTRPRLGERRPKLLSKVELVVVWILMAALALWAVFTVVHELFAAITRTAHGG